MLKNHRTTKVILNCAQLRGEGTKSLDRSRASQTVILIRKSYARPKPIAGITTVILIEAYLAERRT